MTCFLARRSSSKASSALLHFFTTVLHHNFAPQFCTTILHHNFALHQIPTDEGTKKVPLMWKCTLTIYCTFRLCTKFYRNYDIKAASYLQSNIWSNKNAVAVLVEYIISQYFSSVKEKETRQKTSSFYTDRRQIWSILSPFFSLATMRCCAL